MSSHTPGPWHCGTSLNCPGQFFIGQPGHCVTLAHVHNFPDDQREANARLIAAAPDLLAALKLMLDADVYADGEGIVSIANSNTRKGERAVLAARAAIARAEGKL